jgi:hypothetical protein
MRGVAIFALVFAAAVPAHAQLGGGLGDPVGERDREEPSRRPARPERARSRIPGLGAELGDPAARWTPPIHVEPTAPEPPWAGPQVQMAYSFYRVADGYGGGDAHTGGLEVFIQLPLREFRLGALIELGSHDYSLGGDDLIVRGGVEIGVQLLDLLDPFVPHASVLVSVGGIVGTRFDTTVAHAFAGGGLALGGALRIFRNLHAGFEVSYQRLEMDGAGFDVFMLRLALGL